MPAILLLRAMIGKGINRLIFGNSGEVSVDRMRLLLNRAIYVSCSLFVICFALGARVGLMYYEGVKVDRVMSKIDNHLVQQQDNINSLFSINTEQHQTNVRLAANNVELKNRVFVLTRENKELLEQNGVLKDSLNPQKE